MQELSTKTQVEWRRKHVFELGSKGLNQVEIARKLQLHESTISRDLDFIRGILENTSKRDYLKSMKSA